MDETQSQETAFIADTKTDDVFKFDEEKVTTPAPQAEKDTKEDTSTSSEDKPAVDDEPGQRIPYSRFKSVVSERDEFRSQVSNLNERLAELEKSRQTPTEDLDVPQEWVELYGDGDASKKAWAIQLRREEKLQEAAIEKAIEIIEQRETEQAQHLSQNEEIIDEKIAALEEQLGKKLTAKQEEELLSIVDEYSPVGDDGKYTGLIDFNRAWKILEMSSHENGRATKQARREVASIVNATSEGETDSSSAPFERGWDNWRKAL
jgi:hypothetical protein